MDISPARIATLMGLLAALGPVGCDRDNPDPTPHCGDGVLDPGESCDGTALGGETCTSQGFEEGGDLACTADCTLDTAGCSDGYCGDGIINGGEVCDGPDMSAVTCVATCGDYGFYAGALSCTADCSLDPSTCEQRCGDGVINGPEVCDGSALGGDTCAGLGYHDGGDLACAPDCLALDLSDCGGGLCGDGEINGDEECEENDLDGFSCEDFGHVGGSLACAADCNFDLSACHDDVCGDDLQTGAEACDGSDLGGATCTSVGYYGGGDLSCNQDCTLDTAGCLGGFCGDGVINGTEACDGSDLDGVTCEDFGLVSPALTCSATCLHDTSTCQTNWACGDALVDARDGKSYPTLDMGGLCWMAANLDVGIRIDTTVQQTDNAVVEKYCYNDDPSQCAVYAGLYQWNELMGYIATEGAQGICPAGWRVPTDEEWKELEIAAGMDAAIADLHMWRGPPAGTVLQVGGGSGFDVLLGGAVSATGISYNNPTYGYYWTSTLGAVHPWRRCLTSGPSYSPDTIGRWETWPATYALSVRCVADP